MEIVIIPYFFEQKPRRRGILVVKIAKDIKKLVAPGFEAEGCKNIC